MRAILACAIVAVVVAGGILSCVGPSCPGPSPTPIPTWYGWPMWQYDPQHTGHGQPSGIITNSTTLRWSCPGAGIISSPVVDEYGTIYFGRYDGKLYALNASDGTQKFSTLLTNPNVRITSAPVLSGSGSKYPGRIYIATEENSTGNNFFAVNATTGDVIWPLQVPGGGQASAISGYSPLVVTDPANGEPVIYIGAYDGYLYCIRDYGDHGEVKWRRQLQDPDPEWAFHSIPAMSPVAPPNQLGTIYCGGQETNNGRGILFALDPYTGAINTTETIVLTDPGQWVASPSVAIIDGVETIFVGTCAYNQTWSTGTGQMCAVKIVAGTAYSAANYSAVGMPVLCPAIYDLNGDGEVEVIFGGDLGPPFCYVYAITYNSTAASWNTYWTYQTDHPVIESSPAIALAPEPTVFVGAGSPNGGMICSISWNGTLLGNYSVPELSFVETSPAVAQEITDVIGAPGWVFVACTNMTPWCNPGFNGTLYAFGPAP